MLILKEIQVYQLLEKEELTGANNILYKFISLKLKIPDFKLFHPKKSHSHHARVGLGSGWTSCINCSLSFLVLWSHFMSSGINRTLIVITIDSFFFQGGRDGDQKEGENVVYWNSLGYRFTCKMKGVYEELSLKQAKWKPI